MSDLIINQYTKELKSIMKRCINRKDKNGKVYYFFKITEANFDKEIKYILSKLYQKGFEQGVYTAK